MRVGYCFVSIFGLSVLSIFPVSVLAGNSLDKCAEYAPEGVVPVYTCTVDAHIVEPWSYHLPGLPRATQHYLSEAEAIDQRISDIKAGSSSICSEVTYEMEGYDRTWSPDSATTGFSFKTQDAAHRKKIVFNWLISLGGQCKYARSSSDYVYSRREARCSENWGTNWGDSRTLFCYQVLSQEVAPPDPPNNPENPPSCQTCPCDASPQPGSMSKHPIFPATGEKYRYEEDLASPAPSSLLALTRVYRSSRVGGGASQVAERVSVSMSSAGSSGGRSAATFYSPRYEDVDSVQIFGEGWSSSINGVIRFNNPTADFSTSLPTRAYISLGDGRYRSFVRRADGTWIPKGMHNDKLVLGAPNDQVGYLHFIFQTIDTDTQYIFKVVSTPSINPDFPEPNHMAVLSLIRKPKNQWVRIDHEFNSGSNQFNPVRAIDHAGYSLLLSYNGAGQVHSATLNNPASNQISNASYTYDNEKRLASVTYHDGNTRYFIYTNTQNPKLLTGWGWNGVQQEFYAYDDQGLAVGSSLINGIDSTQIDYSAATQSESTYIYYKNVGVIDALGTRRSYNYTSAGHRLNVSVANLHGFYENQPGADTNPPNLSQYNP